MSTQVCSVPGCSAKADCVVILYDFYPHNGVVFFEKDVTCPYICVVHRQENEKGIDGVREPRGCCEYPFTNKNMAQGFTIYRPIDS